MAELTPMMKQYMQIKNQHKNEILFYRLGDFYEMFFEDAEVAARELELVLTGRDCGLPKRAPMCGIPYHAADNYIAKLIAKGYKVAVCEQTEDPATAKGLVSRDIIRIVSPGTVTESVMLDESKNNYLCCAFFEDGVAGLCFCDISTGNVSVTQMTGERLTERIISELVKLSPSELLCNAAAKADKKLTEYLARKTSLCPECLPDDDFGFSGCRETVERHFAKTLTDLRLDEMACAVCALGASLAYLRKMQCNDLSNITQVHIYFENKFMRLDAAARRNLELTENERRREKKGSLLWVLDKTETPMGKRLIRSWVEQPLVGAAGILYRQNAVEELVADAGKRTALNEKLSHINDLERIITRIVYGTANAKELRALSQTLSCLPDIRALLNGSPSRMLQDIADRIDCMTDLCERIDSVIVDEPPFSVREGGMIRPGCNAELDELRSIENGGKDYLTAMENREREATGIKKLKIGYNRVFGYYIEVSNQFKESVPDYYIRKQTLVNGERFITSELKELEAKMLGAKERICKIEYDMFNAVREEAAQRQNAVRITAEALAEADVLSSFAGVAFENNYCRPVVDDSDVIDIREGRHPVVEKYLDGVPFVPNDTFLNCSDARTAIITGPNMAGKSTFMRQIALIVVMAQIGSFVPAKSATVGIVDAVFTRVGASDDLAAGQSTFMTEMSEVSSILALATVRSLVILDEIGRGTSTFDGMSIARSVLEYINDRKKIGCKTLFATHYHELTAMENELDGIRNYNTSVKKRGDEITFLRRILRGSADGSYGIEVALLAGIPKPVVNRAKVILKELEATGTGTECAVPGMIRQKEPSMQLSLTAAADNAVLDEIRAIDTDTLTPIEALTKLYEIKKKLR